MSSVIPFIVGPTGIGKTALSILIAEHLSIEVVSADSRQIYKYLDIGTAKAEPEIIRQIPHHFIDCCRPDEYFSAGKFSREARSIIQNIRDRKNVPLVVGGSGFYIQALIDGIFELEAKDEKIRASLDDKLNSEGPGMLFNELTQVDPHYASKISANDTQRILRALEVFHITGKAFSDWHKQETDPAPFETLQYGLTMDREKLYERINRRVDLMLEQGLVDEVKRLQELGYNKTMNALNTVGYKEVFQYLEGQIDYSEMAELIKRNSRRYAKRQMTWFRRDQRISWNEINDMDDLKNLADEIIRRVSG